MQKFEKCISPIQLQILPRSAANLDAKIENNISTIKLQILPKSAAKLDAKIEKKIAPTYLDSDFTQICYKS